MPQKYLLFGLVVGNIKDMPVALVTNTCQSGKGAVLTSKFSTAYSSRNRLT